MLLEELSNLRGVSGYEDDVRAFIMKNIIDHCERSWTDSMGNLYAERSGKGKRIGLFAHMDEVGLMITGTEAGLLNFGPVGGIRESLLPGTPVCIGKEKIEGVIGSPPIHLQKKDERNKWIPLKNLMIDVGDSADKVSIGDMVTFSTIYKSSRGIAYGKAFDDRIGCYCLIEALKAELDIPMTCVFTVQEEIGLRGARVAGDNIDIDCAVVCEGTFALDLPNTPEEQRMPKLKQGPAITIADRTMISDKGLREKIEKIAKKNDIPYQYKRPMAGGTDAGMIHLTGGGVPSCVIANPCRYIHSPCSIASLNDIENTKELIIRSLTPLSEGI